MEVSARYRARPLHLSSPPAPHQLSSQPQHHQSSHLPPPRSNQPIPLSPNTLLSFQSPEDIEHALAHRPPPGSVHSPGYADGQAIFDLYGNSPTAHRFSDQHHQVDVARQPSIKLTRPEGDESADPYGGTEETEAATVAEGDGERGSWNSVKSEPTGGQEEGQPRGSTMSAMTMESEMDPFAFSRYTSGPLQRAHSARQAQKPGAVPFLVGDKTLHSDEVHEVARATRDTQDASPSRGARRTQHHAPQDTPGSDTTHASIPATTSPLNEPLAQPTFSSASSSTPSSPPTPQPALITSDTIPPAGVLAGRAKTHSPIKNYSRPNFSRPVAREREDSAGSVGGRELTPAMARSDSTASAEGRGAQLGGGSSSIGHGSATSVSLNRSDSNGYGGSSNGHGSSVQSHGGGSTSASWEERQQWNRPSFEHHASYYSPNPRPGGSLSSSRQETLRPDGTVYSPQMSDTYGPLYPAGGPALSQLSSGGASPALVPPPKLGRSDDGATASPPSSPRPRNVLRKPRPIEPPLSPPKEKEHGWFKSWAKARSPQPQSQPLPPPPRELAIPEPDPVPALDPRASFGTARTDATGFTSTSFVPRTQRDWGLTPQEAQRRAHERQAQEQMSLQPGAGKRTAAGFVHRGEPGLAPEWRAVEQIAEEDEVESLHALGLSLPHDGQPHSRAGSQVSQGQAQRPGPGDDSRSLYSNYSYYTLPESNANSPLPSPNPDSSPMLQQKALARQSTTLEKTKAGLVGQLPKVALTPAEAQSPEDFLQLGIEFHEGGELERSAWCFEQSTKRDGGCGAGFLMYGLALRHGWGCQMQPELGFSHLQRAAESVVGELSQFSPDALPDLSAQSAARVAVVLALYEMGTSFRFGWGTPKDKKMAVEYFTMAAELGDVDAQSDLAFCYVNGKGCKKDMRRAARYYRMAVAQGGESFGLSWIYKPKYMDT